MTPTEHLVDVNHTAELWVIIFISCTSTQPILNVSLSDALPNAGDTTAYEGVKSTTLSKIPL